MPLPLVLAAAAVPTIYKALMGISQNDAADNLQKHDSTTSAQREAWGQAKQLSTAQLPGYGEALNQLNAGTNNVLAAGERAGTSSSSILGLLSAADASRAQGLGLLGQRQDAFHQQGVRQQQAALQQQSAQQQHDQDVYDRNKAALREAGQRNLYGAIDSGSQLAAYALSKIGKKDGDGSDDGTGDVSSVLNGALGSAGRADAGALPQLTSDATRRRYKGFGFKEFSALGGY